MEDQPTKDKCWAIEIQQLTKDYGDQYVLRGIDLKVREGEFLAIFGPNGAGKTTMLKVLATLTRPSSGDAWIGGFDIRKEPIMVRHQIGVVTHQTLLYDDLSAYENLIFYGKMYAVSDLKKRIHQLLANLGLESRLHDPVRTLSRGMQQKLAIARALLHDPPVLLLDEPGTGLDQQASDMLVKILSSQNGRQRTVIMTTHLAECVKSGLTRTVGVSNFGQSRMLAAYSSLARHNVPLAANQVHYSLLHRTAEKDGTLARCKELGIRLIAYSPIEKGLLSGKYSPANPPPGARARGYSGLLPKLHILLRRMTEIGQDHGGKPNSQVALNWVICKGALPIPGAKNAEQALENAGALGWRLTDDEVATLEAASDNVME